VRSDTRLLSYRSENFSDVGDRIDRYLDSDLVVVMLPIRQRSDRQNVDLVRPDLDPANCEVVATIQPLFNNLYAKQGHGSPPSCIMNPVPPALLNHPDSWQSNNKRGGTPTFQMRVTVALRMREIRSIHGWPFSLFATRQSLLGHDSFTA
jgi:hypothetical protein